MAISTIFGCLWISGTILSCLFNPLRISSDSTTLSTVYISFPSKFLQETFIYNQFTWVKLQGLYVGQFEYACKLGLCKLSHSNIVQWTSVKTITAVERTTSVLTISDDMQATSVVETISESTEILSSFTVSPAKPQFKPALPRGDENTAIKPTFNESPPTKHPKPALSPEEEDDDDSSAVIDLLDRVLIGTTGLFSMSTIFAIMRCICKKKKLTDKFLRYCRRKNRHEQHFPYFNPTYQRLDAETGGEVEGENNERDDSERDNAGGGNVGGGDNAEGTWRHVDLGDGDSDVTVPLNLSSFNTTADSTSSNMSTFFSPVRQFINNHERLQRILTRKPRKMCHPPRVTFPNSFFNIDEEEL